MVKNRSVSHLLSRGSRNQAEQLTKQTGQNNSHQGLGWKDSCHSHSQNHHQQPQRQACLNLEWTAGRCCIWTDRNVTETQENKAAEKGGGESREETVAKAPSSVAPQSGPKGGPGASGPIPGGWAATLSRRGGDG